MSTERYIPKAPSGYPEAQVSDRIGLPHCSSSIASFHDAMLIFYVAIAYMPILISALTAVCIAAFAIHMKFNSYDLLPANSSHFILCMPYINSAYC